MSYRDSGVSSFSTLVGDTFPLLGIFGKITLHFREGLFSSLEVSRRSEPLLAVREHVGFQQIRALLLIRSHHPQQVADRKHAQLPI